MWNNINTFDVPNILLLCYNINNHFIYYNRLRIVLVTWIPVSCSLFNLSCKVVGVQSKENTTVGYGKQGERIQKQPFQYKIGLTEKNP